MNEEQIKHASYQFYKADSSRHDFDSSGLGKGALVFFTLLKSTTGIIF